MKYYALIILGLFLTHKSHAQSSDYEAGMESYLNFDYTRGADLFLKAKTQYEKSGNRTMKLSAQAYWSICQVYNGAYISAIGSISEGFVEASDEFGENSTEVSDFFTSFGKYYEVHEVYDTALLFYDAALAIKLAQDDQDALGLIDLFINKGIAFDYSGQYDSAIYYYSKGLANSRSKWGENHAYVAYLYNDLGVVYKLTEDYPNSLNMALSALESRRAVYGDESFEAAQSLHNVGVGYEDNGRYEKALSFHHESLMLKIKIFGIESEETAKAYASLGNAYSRANKYPEAIETSLKNYNLWQKISGERSSASLSSMKNLGNVYFDAGQFNESLITYLKYLKLATSSEDQDAEDIAEVKLNIAECHENLNDYQNAEKYFLQASSTQSFKTVYTKAVIGLARIYNAKSKFQQSMALLEKLLSNTAVSNPLRGFILNNLAVVYMDLSNYTKALELINESLSIREKKYGTESQEVAQTLSTLGRYFFDKEEFKKSFNAYAKALRIKEIGFGRWHPKTLSALLNLSAAYGQLGNYKVEIGILDSLTHKYREYYGKEYSGEVSLLMNKAIAQDRLGKIEESISLARRAVDLAILLHGEFSVEVADAETILASLLVGNGRLAEGLTLNQRALSTLSGLYSESHVKKADLLNNIGVVYLDQQESERARDYFQRALIEYNVIFGKRSKQSVGVYNNLAMTVMAQSKYDVAIELFHENLIRIDSSPESDLGIKSTVYQNLGLCYLGLRQDRKAYKQYQKSLSIKKSLLGESHYEIGDLMVNMANCHLRFSDNDSALVYMSRAKEIYEKTFSGGDERLARCFNNLANLMIRSGSLEEAGAYLTEASKANKVSATSNDYISQLQQMVTLVNKIDLDYLLFGSTSDVSYIKDGQSIAYEADKLLASIERSIFSEQDKIQFSIYKTLLTNIAVKNAAYLYSIDENDKHLEDAFYFAERSKSGVLLSALKSTQVKTFGAIDKSLIETEKNLEVAIQKTTLQLHKLDKSKGADVDQKREGLQLKLFGLNRKYEENQMKQKMKYKKYFDLRHDQSVVSLKKLKNSLKDSEGLAVVEYALSDSLLHAIVVHKGGATIISSPTGEPFDKKLNAFRKAIVFKADNVLQLVSQEIYDIVMRGVEDYFSDNNLNIDQLIIIPEGPLNYVPFEALSKNNQDQKRYLIEDYNISYSYSVSLLEFIEDRERKDVENGWLAFAPVFSPESGTGSMNETTKEFHTFTARAMTEGTRAFTLDGQYIEPLPGTETEVREIDKMVRKSGLLSRYFTFKKANESVLKSDILKNYRFIHFATHGFINEENPAYSGILMSQNTDSEEDCVLHASEIYNLEINAELVTLSACETGLGKMAFGEGIVGLSRSFLYAGASNLLVSQWKVNDASTSQLMINFYGNILGGAEKSHALRMAKLDLLKSDQFNKPYYWAPFVLIGK